MENKVTPYCMSCGKIKIDDRWLLVGADALQGYNLSHGYCDNCAEEAIAEAKHQIEKAKHPNQEQCVRCEEWDMWYNIKKGLCTYCQPCSLCETENCEKEFNHNLAITICLECGESVIDRAERKRRYQESLI